jgi:hypothetical protein
MQMQKIKTKMKHTSLAELDAEGSSGGEHSLMGGGQEGGHLGRVLTAASSAKAS